MPRYAPARVRRLSRAALLLLGAALPACSDGGGGGEVVTPPPPVQQTRDQKWRADLALLASELESRHPNPFFHRPRAAFQADLARLDGLIPSLTDAQVTVGMMELVASLGDSHTGFTNALPRLSRYPISIYWLSDGLFINGAPQDRPDLLRGRIVRIGNVSTDSALALVARVIPHENEYRVRAGSRTYLITDEVLRWVGMAGAGTEMPFEVEREEGGRTTVLLAPQPWTSVVQVIGAPDAAQYPLYLRRRNENYWHAYLADSRTLYVKYNVCEEMQNYPFSAFAADVLRDLETNDVDRIVFDLRANQGGSTAFARPLIEELGQEALARGIPYAALIDNHTVSAGMIHALHAKGSGAVLLGEPTGGKPNAYMTALSNFTLPHSGLSVFNSTALTTLLPGNDTPALFPDVLVPLTSADFFANRDPVLERVMQME